MKVRTLFRGGGANADTTPIGRPEPWLSTALRVVVHAVTAGVIAFPLTTPQAVFAAMLGGATGSFLARFAARTSLRLPALLAIGAGGLVGVLLLRALVVDLVFVPAELGPATALELGDAIVFGLGALVVSTVLRVLSTRRPALSVLEAGLVAGGFATLLVAHRNGAIHRPYVIADPLIARGEDPTLAILLLGAAGAVVIGLLLLSERSVTRSLFHFGVVAALLLAILGTTTMVGLPTPPNTGGALGLQDNDHQGGGRAGGQGQQNGRRRSDELEFLDQYPHGGGTPDAVIIFHDDYSPDGGYYYFRQSAFSQFNGRKLVAATRQDVDQDVRNLFPTNRSRDVLWIPPEGADRTEVETTVAMLADNSAPLGLEAPTRFIPATNPNPQRFRRVYRVQSRSTTADFLSLLGRSAGDPSWSEEIREHYLRGPDDPRYRELALRIVDSLPPDLKDDPLARALSITQYLGEHGTYSLRSRHAGAEDPTADFLFGDLTGYCVHFAHAAVYLMRSIGIPARVGTGYAVAEANRQGGSALLLRNSDQHAWPEVYLGAAPSPIAPVLDALRALTDTEHPDALEQVPEEQRLSALMIVRMSADEEGLDSEAEDGPLTMPDVSSAASTRAELSDLAAETERSEDDLVQSAIARIEALSVPETGDAAWVVADVAPQNVLDPPGEPPDSAAPAPARRDGTRLRGARRRPAAAADDGHGGQGDRGAARVCRGRDPRLRAALPPRRQDLAAGGATRLGPAPLDLSRGRRPAERRRAATRVRRVAGGVRAAGGQHAACAPAAHLWTLGGRVRRSPRCAARRRDGAGRPGAAHRAQARGAALAPPARVDQPLLVAADSLRMPTR